MPKEQGPSLEHVTSKNAKDKSNSATLRASQGGTRRQQSGKRDMSNHMLHSDSEKESERDSGYSEAGSDSVHTDGDDQHSTLSGSYREGKRSSNINANGAGPSISAYEELTPVYLMVKPSRQGQLLHGSLAWGGSWHSLTSGKTPTQLLLIQHPQMPAPSSSTLVAPPCLTPRQVKDGGSPSNQKYRSKNAYLPILNSYPRIAPHPRKEIHEGKGAVWAKGIKEGNSEGQSQSKRACIEDETREMVSTTSTLLKPQQQHHHKEVRVLPQHRGRGGHSSFPSSPRCPLPGHATFSSQHKSHHNQHSSASDIVGSPSISSSSSLMPSLPSSSDSPSSCSPSSSSPSSSAAHSPYHPAPDSSSTRQRRFLNTAEILNQSGLLAITLRTKELLKQNAATEREIAQLRQHMDLLTHAAQVSQNGCIEGSGSLDKLFQAMSQSGSYPNLAYLGDLQQLGGLSSTQEQNKSSSEEDKEKDNNIATTTMHSSPQRVVYLHTIDDGTSPPSPLFAPSPTETEHADSPLLPMSTTLSASYNNHFLEQGHRQAGADKDISDLIMLPESSTHTNYLL
ncbi:CLOCK-interacting pacemaker-like isoform 1-T2 [Pholidichthys leucotaenia]